MLCWNEKYLTGSYRVGVWQFSMPKRKNHFRSERTNMVGPSGKGLKHLKLVARGSIPDSGVWRKPGSKGESPSCAATKFLGGDKSLLNSGEYFVPMAWLSKKGNMKLPFAIRDYVLSRRGG